MDANPAIADAALALRQARASQQPIPPVSATYGIASIEEAYAVAGLNNAALSEAGHRPSGTKIGLTAKAVQKQLGVDQPDFGVLFDDMEFLNRDVVPMTRLIQPKVEAEIAFVAARDIGASGAPRWYDFLASLAYALPAIEIVDSAIADWKITLFDTIADNASSGLYVLGDQPVAIGSVQLADVAMEPQRTTFVERVSAANDVALVAAMSREADALAASIATSLGSPGSNTAVPGGKPVIGPRMGRGAARRHDRARRPGAGQVSSRPRPRPTPPSRRRCPPCPACGRRSSLLRSSGSPSRAR